MFAKGPRHFQQVTREIVMEHRRREENAQGKIWPAVPAHAGNKQNEDDIIFCNGLSSDASKLSW